MAKKSKVYLVKSGKGYLAFTPSEMDQMQNGNEVEGGFVWEEDVEGQTVTVVEVGKPTGKVVRSWSIK